MANTIRKSDTSKLPALAQLWYDGWQVTHAANAPASLAPIRTLESFETSLTADLNSFRVFDEIVHWVSVGVGQPTLLIRGQTVGGSQV